MQTEELDVLLVQPPYPGLCFETTNVPLGLAWISAVLKREGFTTCGYDMQVEGMDLYRLAYEIEIKRPKVVGLQFHGQVSFNYSMEALTHIKKNFPNIPVVVGGQQATFRPRPILEEGGADFLVTGEGEFIMPELVKYLLGVPGAAGPDSIPSLMFKDNGRIYTNERAPRIENLDSIPLPDRDAFNWKKYPQWVIMTSRGCPYTCGFCSSASFWGHQVKFRSAENVVAEMQQLVDKYDVHSFLILDDTFTLNKPRLKKICNEISARKLPISWGCGTRMDQVDEETFKLLRSANCVEISFGLETNNQKTLDRINKNITVEQQRRGILLAKQAGFQTRVSTMLGLPGETETEINNTLNFLLETQPNEIQVYPILPFDGTDFNARMDEHGITILNHNFSDWVKDSFAPIAETKWLTRERLVQMTRHVVQRLSENGYTHMTGKEEVGKKKLDKVVSTGLTPFQLVESANVS
jgi:anaerobic magnesium-protoporphyrin IX monomethyl ester cyclase